MLAGESAGGNGRACAGGGKTGKGKKAATGKGGGGNTENTNVKETKTGKQVTDIVLHNGTINFSGLVSYSDSCYYYHGRQG